MALQVGRYLVTLPRSLVRTNYSPALRYSSLSNTTVKALHYQEYGEPAKVLSVKTHKICKPESNQVSVKWLLAPVNPADINTIQGKYPSKPPLPATPGNEGLGVVTAIGPDVRGLHNGDKVIPNGANLGTWKTHGIYAAEDLLKIPKDIGDVEASMLNVNPCTAYRMLKDFVPVKGGETVIQNGANSAVGQNVIQICKAWGIKSVNIVRDRPEIAALKVQLFEQGATEVLTEAELRTTDIFKSNKLPKPKLALNCVCGKNALEVMRHLSHGGTMVTYGGMSREPLTIPTSGLIFKDITLKGFWMTAWTKNHVSSEERAHMYNELALLIKEKKLQPPPYKLVPFNHYQEAIDNTLTTNGKAGLKYILDMTKE